MARMASIAARTLATWLAAWRAGTSGPAYAALADRIRLLVLDGRVPIGARLPAERELAAQLGLSRTTVSSAYASLRDAGYLDSLRGSGSVARLPRTGEPAFPETAGGLLDFSKASMTAYPAVAAAAERAAAELPRHLGESGFDPVGLPLLRRAIAERYTARGLPTDEQEVVVTIGAQHAIALLARTLVARGDRVLVESPSYPHAFEALKLVGGRLVGVNVTAEDGWDADGLAQTMQRTSPSLAYLMPDSHNPTGRRMPQQQRETLAELAARHGTTLVIDETMAGLELEGQAAPPPFAATAAALGAGANVVTIGSVGKAIWGGLRVGWIRASRELVQRIALVRFAGDLGTPLLEQLIVAQLLPELDRILADRRGMLRAGRDHLAAGLARELPQWRMPRVESGITAWVNLGAPVSSQLAIAARAEGLVIAAGPWFGFDGAFERFVRIPFAYPHADLDAGIELLARAWSRLSSNPIAAPSADFAQLV